jgi:hypothetical protein
MTFRFDFLYLAAAALFFYTGYHQFYLRQNVDQLERSGRLTPDAAARVRKKPMRLIGCLGFFAGLGFLFLAFVRL